MIGGISESLTVPQSLVIPETCPIPTMPTTRVGSGAETMNVFITL